MLNILLFKHLETCKFSFKESFSLKKQNQASHLDNETLTGVAASNI